MYVTDYMFSQLYPNIVFEQLTDDNMQTQSPPMVPPEGNPNPIAPYQPPEMAGAMDQDPNQGPPGQTFGGGEDSSNGAIEFENIKRYVLYDKLKDLRHRLELTDVDYTNPNVINILEFIDLITLFYNTFTYEDTVKLFDNLIETISTELKIKLPSRTENLPDEEFPEEAQLSPEIQAEDSIS